LQVAAAAAQVVQGVQGVIAPLFQVKHLVAAHRLKLHFL
tara:strand:- start:216 stop:332 length:117 start_codon:yes stop_codon:yes gene_type:complete